MRVLFTTIPEPAVFRSMVPLAWALRTAGHEVCVAAPPQLTEVITRAGLTAVPVGAERDIWQSFDTHPAELATLRTALHEPYDAAVQPDVTWEYLKSGYDRQVTWWHKMDAFPVIADLVGFARHWRPDLVIWEPTSYAGPIAAKAVGAAHARLLWGLDVFGVTRDHYLRLMARQRRRARADALADWLGHQAGRFGAEFTEDMTCGQVTIDPLPGSLRMPAALRYVPMRYVSYEDEAVVPAWSRVTPERPRVALTLGETGAEAFGGHPVKLPEILDAVSDLDVDIIATGPGDPPVPMSELVPTCAAVVHHPSPAALATAALHGVPQLILPVYADEPPLAGRIADQGAGVELHSSQATAQSIRDTLLRLLKDPAFGTRAARLSEEMLAMPTPREVVGRLEGLTAELRAGV